MSGGSSSGPPAALAIQPLRGPLGIAPSQDDPSWAITIIARLALSPSTPARQTACPLRASGVDRSARPSKRACHAHQCRSVGLPLPVNQPVNYAKHDTPIALACALGGSTKLSAGGFVLVSVEVRSRQVGMMHSYIRGKPRERCQQSVRQPQPPKPCARAVVRTPRITVPRPDNAGVCRNAGSSRKTQMNVIIQKRNGLWYLIVGSCQIRTPFLETQSREWVVAYARQIYPGAKIFEHD